MQNKKAVNTLYHVFTAFLMRQIIFKNTHIQVVEATRAVSYMRKWNF